MPKNIEMTLESGPAEAKQRALDSAGNAVVAANAVDTGLMVATAKEVETGLVVETGQAVEASMETGRARKKHKPSRTVIDGKAEFDEFKDVLCGIARNANPTIELSSDAVNALYDISERFTDVLIEGAKRCAAFDGRTVITLRDVRMSFRYNF